MFCVFECACKYVCVCVCLCVYEWYVCLISVVSALFAGVGGVWRIEAECIVCLCVRVSMCACMCVCVCLCVYEWYVGLISVVLLSLQVGVVCGGMRMGPVSVYVVSVLSVCVCVYVCISVCLCVYEWYVCLISVVSDLSAGVD